VSRVKRAASLQVVPVDSWSAFQEIVAGPTFRSWAFRGQGDARWPLYSSISRYLLEHRVDPGAWAEQEERILRIFRRKAHLYLAHVPAEADAFQWLALMQHHGAPTRLLDFTWSPFVAAFFALERATAPAAVWALCLPEIWKAKHKFPGRKARVTEDELGLASRATTSASFSAMTSPSWSPANRWS